MPKYQVTEPRFYNNVMYGPGTGRNFITTEKPFPKNDKGELPSGLVLVEITQEKQNDIEEKDVTFTESPSAVQTLS